MSKKIIIYFIAGIFIGGIVSYLLLNAISGNETISKTEIAEAVHNDDHSESEEKHSEVINISDEVKKEFGIEVKSAGEGKIAVHQDLTGEVVPNPYNVAHIVPRFKGIVKAVYKKIGDNIKKGEIIATIESNESLVSYDVASSIDGTILELHMTLGELIGDAEHIVMIANLNNVWAELSIYQQDLGKVKVGQTVEITSPHSKTVFKGKLFYISPTVNEATRTAVARVMLNNRIGIWKPGMFVSGSVLTNHKIVKVAVSKNAVQILNGEKVIFVSNGEGFRPQVVTLGMENSKLIEVIDGLHVGDKYISKGAYTIKSEILKESFGGDEH